MAACVKLADLALMSLSDLSKIFRHAAAVLNLRLSVQCFCLLALTLTGLPLAQALTPGFQCANGKAAEDVEHIGTSQDCVAIRKFEPTTSGNSRLLVVFLPGDSRRNIELAVNDATVVTLSEQLKARTISVHRLANRSSTGGTDDVQGDIYSPSHIAMLATALANLRVLNPGKKILLIGHSDGAAMTALLASRFPVSADAYLLAACPCDVPRWLQWRNGSAGKADNWTHSLSPQDEVKKIRATTRIALVVGNRDDNTLAKFSETYVTSLQRQGVKIRLTYAIGATHASVLRSPEFFMLAQQLSADLSR